jgi:hypothetical protein
VTLGPAKAIYDFARAHQDSYHGWSSLARVCLLYPARSFSYGTSAPSAYRGMFRLLTENHVLFDCAHDFRLEAQDADAFLKEYDLLVLPGAACLSDRQLAAIDCYVHSGGRLLATGETALYTERGRRRDGYGLACLGAERVLTRRDDMRSAYFRVHDREVMARLPDTDLIFLDKRYLYTALKEGATTSLTLVPPCIYGPPEKCFIDKIESVPPGVIWFAYGQGKSAYLPWAIDSLYYWHSAPGHERTLLSILLNLLPGRQVVTDANPQVAFSLFARDRDRYVLNLVNSSGHHGTAFFPPITMHDIQIELKLPAAAHAAFSLKLAQSLAVTDKETYTCFTLPRLALFDTIEIKT